MMEEVLLQELAHGGRSQIQLEQEPSPVTEESLVQDENQSRVSTGHNSDVNGSPSLNKDEDEYGKHERLELDDNEPEFGGVDEDDKELEQEDVQDLGEEVEEEEEEFEEEEEGDVVEEFEDDHEELEHVEQPDHENEHAKLKSVEEEEEHHAVFKERRKRKEFEIFVGGLDKDASEDDLRKAFNQVGEITEVRLIMNPQTKKNKGFAFLHFATVEQAKRAVKELRNPVINGKQCGVTPSKESDTLFLGNICKSWTVEALREKLRHYGVDRIDDLTLVEDTNNEGMNRGFAFLEFSSRSNAMDAFKRLQKRDIFFGVDRPAKVSFAYSFIDPGEEIMAQVKTVFIDGLLASWDEDRVREFLKKYGAVEKIELARNMPSARRKDFGFVTFDTHEAAVTCAKSINNTELGEGDNKAKVRACLSRPLQRGKGKQFSRGDHHSGRVQASVSWGPWIHSSACSLPSSSARNICSHVPLSGSVKRHVGLRDRRPPVMPLPSRSRAVAPLPPPRSYYRRSTQNFEKLFEQVKALNIDNARTLAGVVSQIFDKAVMEPNFCEMYANVCYQLAGELPDFVEDNEPITFKRLLLNNCQFEFERGEEEQEEADRADAEGEIKQSSEEREEKRLNARRRTLGNIRLIGELYKKRMLTERVMHECIKKLLGQYQNPDEEDLEALCTLMSTIGEMIDHPKAKDHMDAYFDRMTTLSNNMKLSSTIRFMLKDSIDLRRNKWQQLRKIDDVHRDAAQELHSLANQLAHSPSMNQSGWRTPMDFGPRGSAMLSPSSSMGGFRGLPSQSRGFGNQDTRFDERQPNKPRMVPLPQRPLGDDAITLGPQGGLPRGMSGRGPPATAGNSMLDPVESRKMMAAFNGFPNVSKRSVHNSREDHLTRYGTIDRIVVPAAYNQINAQERNMKFANKDRRNDRSFDRRIATSPPSQVQAPASTQSLTSDEELLEEFLHDKYLAAIKEYYRGRDEREVASCIKDLDCPSFHPSMVSFWVNDSFERKDMERDLLAKLLVNLTRSEESILTQLQLVKGFESVLTSLEDIVNDAPKAAEFLGRIFGKAVSEKVVPLDEIGQLLLAGGEEPERLKEIGLAGDVIGSILETVRLEKGESLLHETKASSNLHLEDFRPKDGYRSRILEKFI